MAGGNPGIRELASFQLPLASCFPEMRAHIGARRFPNGVHDREPNCAVREAVERVEIGESRYESHLRIRQDEER